MCFAINNLCSGYIRGKNRGALYRKVNKNKIEIDDDDNDDDDDEIS